jgi:cytochrome d ubiquinol oxidase subunit II
VSVATLSLRGAYFDRWLGFPNILWVLPVPVLVAIAAVAFARCLAAGRPLAPYLLTLFVYLLCFVGLGISIFPDAIPGAVTIWQAATDRRSQVFMLFGTVTVLPLILGYTGWAYWIFRGKVRPDGYHA